jgi:hypothetical protein
MERRAIQIALLIFTAIVILSVFVDGGWIWEWLGADGPLL